MEEAVLEELAEGRFDDVLRHLLEVVARLGGDLGDLHALHVLEGEDGLGGEVGQHAPASEQPLQVFELFWLEVRVAESQLGGCRHQRTSPAASATGTG